MMLSILFCCCSLPSHSPDVNYFYNPLTRVHLDRLEIQPEQGKAANPSGADPLRTKSGQPSSSINAVLWQWRVAAGILISQSIITVFFLFLSISAPVTRLSYR
jgi:hypothetical protein